MFCWLAAVDEAVLVLAKAAEASVSILITNGASQIIHDTSHSKCITVYASRSPAQWLQRG